ncbi:L-lysine 6-transaminase [Streptomyces sp. NBC_00986]|uniref:L-lysine 6-transaminase n=1 Tax=Streptomyces sp. NBC_00986 TaxID=2903702 RepID=UPI00386CC2BA|nr:L-lysine 6-transaminase [Streptomyces sp. NBC_00986]
MDPADVREVLSSSILVDGYDFILDLEKSSGSYLVDARTGLHYLDLFSFFSSLPLGMNPPDLLDDADFMARLARAALHKVSNPDVYTEEYAQFVETFVRVLGDPALPKLFFIDGGALAVENALKVAFDWKSRISGTAESLNLKAMHLTSAFHGRSGYTMSMTNTDPEKTRLFPKWDWPRLPTPALRFPLHEYASDNRSAEDAALHMAQRTFEESAGEIACFVAEPILGEGGDMHLSARFLLGMQELCHEFDALFVLDEVQTGCGPTGTAWAYQQLGLSPDVVAFGKKTQVCGVMAGRRVDLVDDNVFRTSSRISSTWGGNLADMVRATRILDIVERDELFRQARDKGDTFLGLLGELGRRHPSLVSNVRGRGLMAAFDLPDAPVRDLLIKRLFTDERVIILPSGERSIRFRPSLTVTTAELSSAVNSIDQVMNTVTETLETGGVK